MANKQRYKRSWKNYLLDANYQLRFTLTMLAVAAGLMAPLGYWVSEKATRATEVALNQIDGIRCPDELFATAPSATGDNTKENPVEVDLLDEGAELPGDEEPEAVPPTEEGTPAESGAGGEPADPNEPADPKETVDPQETVDPDATEASGEQTEPGKDGEVAETAAGGETVEEEEGEERERVRPTIIVDIDDSEMPDDLVVVVGEMEVAPPSAKEIAGRNKLRRICLNHITTEKASVIGRKVLIRNVMLVSALILLLGLGVYGIKTTHRVAGPLFKVGLYLAKLERNVYDTVYNLRKGDQLVEFYDHFKNAHAGVTKMQEEDRDRLRDAIALAKDAKLTDKNPELAALVTELEALLAETEASLGED